MENREIVRFVIPTLMLGFFIFGSPSALAYGVETHAYSTSEIINFYNQSYPDRKIPDELKNYLIDGSRKEDESPRWLNHFYDPVYDRGLSTAYGIKGYRSKTWAQDASKQNEVRFKVHHFIASLLTAAEQRKISEISADADFTWNRAIEFYVQGDREKAMFALGHVLHLIEDLGVPDHTRNDDHVDGSPYEEFAKRFNLNSPDASLSTRIAGKGPISLNNLDAYFNSLATYSNNNFYSEDTIGIQSGYNLPQPVEYEIENGYRYALGKGDEGQYFKLFKQIPQASVLISSKDELIFNAPEIMTDYWINLSAKSVQHGAGVVDLFFQEAEKAKNNPKFAKKEKKNFLTQTINAAKTAFNQVFNKVDKKPVAVIDVNKQNQQGQQKSSTPKVSIDKTTVAQGETLVESGQGFSPDSDVLMHFELPNRQTVTALVKADSSGNYRKDYVIPSNASLGQYAYHAEDLKTNTVSNKVNYVVRGAAIAKKQIETQKKETQEAEKQKEQKKAEKVAKPQVKECGFSIAPPPSRNEVIINEVAWMGGPSAAGLGASDEWIELKNLTSKAINVSGWQIVSQDEDIQVIFKDGAEIPAGRFYLLERTNDDSAPEVSADTVYTGALANTNEGLRLFTSDCNLADEVIANPNWPAGDNSSKRTMQRNADLSWSTFGGEAISGIFGTPRAENGPALAKEETVNKSVSKTSSSGGGGSSSGQSAISSQSPLKILINEIQTSPIGNRFIELYNPNNSSVDLTGWYLQRKTQSGTDFTSLVSKTHFEGKTIGANSYFLISRGALESADIVFDLTLTGSSTIQFKNLSGDVVDRVGWGEAQDCEGNCALNPTANQSIQRKIQNNTFIDDGNNANDFEIQTCPSPKSASSACAVANQAPSASFSFSPQNPLASSTITFNATSSTDDGTISLYLWDFGDGATTSSTRATATHAYSSAGNYGVSLTIFDTENASSSASSTISVSATPPAGLVLFEQPDYISRYTFSGTLSDKALLNPISGSARQLHLKVKPNAVASGTLSHIGLAGIYKNNVFTSFYYSGVEPTGIAISYADQSYYCFSPAQADTWVDVVLTLPVNYSGIFTSGDTYRPFLVGLSNSPNYDPYRINSPCVGNDTTGTGNYNQIEIRTDGSGNLYHQIGNNLF